MTALHMGSLHAIEVVLVVLLAVGPFLGLTAAILVARRRDRAAGSVDTTGQPQENSWC